MFNHWTAKSPDWTTASQPMARLTIRGKERQVLSRERPSARCIDLREEGLDQLVRVYLALGSSLAIVPLACYGVCVSDARPPGRLLTIASTVSSDN